MLLEAFGLPWLLVYLSPLIKRVPPVILVSIVRCLIAVVPVAILATFAALRVLSFLFVFGVIDQGGQ